MLTVLLDCWYRLCHPLVRVSPPEAAETVSRVKEIHDKTINLKRWERVPFPSPLDHYFDFVYTIDQDAGTFIISKWTDDGIRTPLAYEARLADICDNSSISIESLRESPLPSILDSGKDRDPGFDSVSLKPLNIQTSLPTAMLELQQQFFLDFVYLWRTWIDDPITWHYGSRVFKAFSRAILCLASWDFEVSYNCDVPLPVNHSSIPRWQFPEEESYWFHEFLIMLQPDLESRQMLLTAIAGAKALIRSSSRTTHKARSILISPRHIAFVEIFEDTVACSKVLPLLADSSASKCSPGFRVLAQALSTDCWKETWAHREKWPYHIPPEILSEILHSSEPRDAVSFAQASFEAERSYYASVPQFKHVSVHSLYLSIPCCGDRTGLEDLGVYCSKCRIWQHQKCIGLETLPSENSFTCATCLKEDQKKTQLTPGGINRLDGRLGRKARAITIDGSMKDLRVRLSKPAHLRLELRNIGDLIHRFPKGLVDFTIRFNGDFTGLAYGLDDIEVESNCRY
ncbi:Zinc finger FYVE/PHD-type [Penicillium concentricum]|uniref:Zinc finger FYVE/PHD-type n=1 Tax=Penicillium concentricum TaxID=293559 RepID=A0A9W9R903_9EURO|nr:Zinc finger FYVE/PHD-type [Penicillium concentricum]KAJ5355925.1 Zinc finger FYVE/PHD-type [Penicillium concentricum]